MKHTVRALALILALQPTLAVAQTFPTVPPNTVIGRLGGNTTGPSQAIPFATLAAQLSPGVFKVTCAADNITDCSASINATIAAAYAYSQSAPITPEFSGGKVYLPAGRSCYRIHASSINMLRNVSLVGDFGNASCISADNVDAIKFAYVSGGGNPTIDGISIVGVNANAARTAIKRLGVTPTSADDIQNGLTLRNVTINGFDTAIDLHTVQIINIDNTLIRNVNQGIVIRGFGGNALISGNTKILKIAGGGSGGTTFTGIDFVPVTYTTGSSPGTLGPEGVTIDGTTQVGGFATGIDIQQANWVNVNNTNVVATVYGIKFGKVQNVLNLTNLNVEMQTSAAVAAIYGVGQATVPTTVTNIDKVEINSNGTTTVADGIRINDTGTSNQNNVTISNSQIRNMQGYDIALYNPGGKNRIVNNRCLSTGNTGSIVVGTIQTRLTTVEGNVCANTITYLTASDLTNGYIRRANNIYNGATSEAASWNVTTDSTTANRPMLGGGAGVQPTALAAGTTTTVLHGNASGAPAYSAIVSADMNITATNCTNQFVSAISTGGIGTCTTDTLASAQHANQGTTTTVLHGNAAGNPSWAQIVSADLNITTTSCSNQFVTAISAGGVGTCTTDTLASAQHANQGTTTTVLHGNAGGNPSWGAISLTADVSGVLPVANGGVNQGSWTSYSPTPTAAVPGTSVLTLNSARYNQKGKEITLQGDVTVTTAGTGSGIISVPLPFAAAAFRFVGAGLEAGLTARIESAYITTSATAVQINDLSGTPAAFANGQRHIFTITYEIP